VRSDLAATIDWASRFATVLATAESTEAADAGIEEIYSSLPDDETLPGTEWLRAACGVDVED
jgi:hypothetical protein